VNVKSKQLASVFFRVDEEFPKSALTWHFSVNNRDATTAHFRLNVQVEEWKPQLSPHKPRWDHIWQLCHCSAVVILLLSITSVILSQSKRERVKLRCCYR